MTTPDHYSVLVMSDDYTRSLLCVLLVSDDIPSCVVKASIKYPSGVVLTVHWQFNWCVYKDAPLLLGALYHCVQLVTCWGITHCLHVLTSSLLTTPVIVSGQACSQLKLLSHCTGFI